jgi:hypothetical protein
MSHVYNMLLYLQYYQWVHSIYRYIKRWHFRVLGGSR